MTATPGLVLMSALGAWAAGALTEVFEFAVVSLNPSVDTGGYQNTGWDLIANLVGATATSAAVWWFERDSG